MSQEQNNPGLTPDENGKSHPAPFETDAQKIVRRHLQNKDDVITEEDIASIRVGVAPSEMDAPTLARFKGDDAVDEVEEQYLDDTQDAEADKDGRVTPWDAIEPK